MSVTNDSLLKSQEFCSKFLKYINATGSPYHSVKQLLKYLDDNNVQLTQLDECEDWNLESGRCYSVTNDNGTLMVFRLGSYFNANSGGLTLAVAHTDSPCLKLEYNCSVNSKGYNQLSACTYGGGLWHTWLDRDLGIAGKVVLCKNDKLEDRLVHIREPLVIVPNLAIHLQNSQERESLKLNKQNHLKPIISTECLEEDLGSQHSVLLKLLSKLVDKYGDPLSHRKLNCDVGEIVDFDLCLMDNTPAVLSGVNREFLTSGRLDNLVSCFASIAAFADHTHNPDNENSIVGVIAYNYEEIGSELGYGADSVITSLWLNKIYSNFGVSFNDVRNKSFLLSCDMAHAIHPNYPEKHIDTHSPQFHKGVVIKRNVNGRYCTDLKSSPILIKLSKSLNIPLQEFRVGNETPCGSTVGPALATRLCIPIADVGVPQLAMHSIRETCSLIDFHSLYLLIKVYFN